MAGSEAVTLLVLRVTLVGEACVIRVPGVRTGELREFTSWNELKRYAEEALRGGLR